MDGVISDTQSLHANIESEVLARWGIQRTPAEITRHYAGVKDDEMFQEIFSQHRIADSFEKAIQIKWELMDRAGSKAIIAIPGVIVLIDRLKKNGFRLALASSSKRAFIDVVLSTLNLIKEFEVIVSGDEVRRGKPDPAIFLLAAKALNVSPGDCLVIEDGLRGMEAARRAGMRCIGFDRDAVLGETPAELMVRDLKQISLRVIQQLDKK